VIILNRRDAARFRAALRRCMIGRPKDSALAVILHQTKDELTLSAVVGEVGLSLRVPVIDGATFRTGRLRRSKTGAMATSRSRRARQDVYIAAGKKAAMRSTSKRIRFPQNPRQHDCLLLVRGSPQIRLCSQRCMPAAKQPGEMPSVRPNTIATAR